MASKAERFAALLGTPKDAPPAENADTKPNDRFCETAPTGMQFAPILAISKFPYKYMSRNHGEIVSKQFFAGGKFWERNWDLWYVWSPYYYSEKPVIFVPLEQFEDLLKEVNDSYPSFNTRMPTNPEGVFVFPFEYSEHKLFRPHFLGHSSSKEDFEHLSNLAPHFGPLQTQQTDSRSDSSSAPSESKIISYFRQDLEAAVDAGKTKGKAYKAKKQEARATKQQDLKRQLERTQHSLGLLPSASSSPSEDVIYIAVDVEAYERNHGIVTEIGIATLDTRDLRDKDPGENGKNWHQHIRARHFRINEYKHYVNTEFVRGCPDSFEFGESEFVDLKDSPRLVASCFRPPYSNKLGDTHVTSEGEKRNIIFVGHDTKQDVSYLRDLGYDPNNLANLIDFQDTAAMWRAMTGEPNARGLSYILYHLDLEAWNTHNAGNDAVYTMHAMLGLCVKDALKKTNPQDDDEGGVSLPTSETGGSKSKKKADGVDWEVLEAAEKFQAWEM